MPMTPKNGEKEDEFISRCISHEINKGTAQDEKQGYAICKNYWDNAKMADNRYLKIKEYVNAKKD